MPDPVNLAAIEQRAGQQLARQQKAQQVASQDRFMQDVEQGPDPAASERTQARLGRFRTLGDRVKTPSSEGKLIKGISEKTEEDLAHSYQRRNPELPADRLRTLKNSLRAEQTAEEILEEVNRAFSDPTLADEALDYLEKGTEGLLKNTIRQARELLQESKGREIAAGRNIVPAVNWLHNKGIGKNPTELRNLYRDITGNPRDHNTLFTELSEEYPFDQLKLVVAFLLKGLGFDLKSKGPSIQQAELMRLMTETRNLQSILWVHLFFKSRLKLIRSLYAQYGLEVPEHLSFEELAKEFIRLVEERYPSVMKLIKKMNQLKFLDDIEKIIILTQYRDAIRGLSPRLYKTTRHRQDLLSVIMETLEDLEEEDEEE